MLPNKHLLLFLHHEKLAIEHSITLGDQEKSLQKISTSYNCPTSTVHESETCFFVFAPDFGITIGIFSGGIY